MSLHTFLYGTMTAHIFYINLREYASRTLDKWVKGIFTMMQEGCHNNSTANETMIQKPISGEGLLYFPMNYATHKMCSFYHVSKVWFLREALQLRFISSSGPPPLTFSAHARNPVAYPGIFFGGGFQQIQLRTEGREDGDLGAVAP